MRSRSESRKERRYTNVREMVEKRAAGFSAPYLKLPEGVTLFKPKKGVMLLDIIPFVAGEDNPYAEEGMIHWERTFWVHKGIGANNESYLCPRKNFKQPCPVCEFRAKIQAEGDGDSEELIQALAPKERQLFNVINRKEPDKGIQLWDFSFHLFGKLLQARLRDADEEEGWDLFFTLDKGMTLRVGFEEKSYSGRAYFEAETLDFKARDKDEYDEDEMLDKAIELDSVLVGEDYEDLKKIFQESSKDVGSPRNAGKDRDRDRDREEQEERGSRSLRDRGREEEPEREGRGSSRRDREESEEEPEERGSGKSRKDEDDGWDNFDKDKKDKCRDRDREEEPEPEERGSKRRSDREEESEPEERGSSKRGGKSRKDEVDNFEDLDEPKDKRRGRDEDEERGGKSRKK